jgi:biopolymer transport protein ExbD
VKLNMPVGTPPPPAEPPVVVTLEIDFDGTLLWNGEQIDRPTLDARLRGAASMPVQPEFHLRPNKLVTYKHVAHVMAAAQRLGVTKIGLIGAEQFLD